MTDAAEAPESARALPPATLTLLVSHLATQALIELGEVRNPMTNDASFAPDRAKLTLDVLQVIKDKTRGNLDDAERRYLDGALYELRMKFVAKLKRPDGG